MSTEAEQAAAAKRVADEAAAAAASEAAAAAAAAASANWPTGGYYMLIPLLLTSMCIVLAISVGGSTICLVLHSYMFKYQYVHIMLMFYSWINLIGKLPRFLTSRRTKSILRTLEAMNHRVGGERIRRRGGGRSGAGLRLSAGAPARVSPWGRHRALDR
jgi:hypothetical protein